MLGSLAHVFLRCLVPAEADIIGNSAREKEGVLRDQTQIPSIHIKIQTADITTVNQQLTLLEFVKASDQFGDAALPCARVADKSECFPGVDYQ